MFVDSGKMVLVEKFSYDQNSDDVFLTAPRFSTYSVGYKDPPAYADMVNHWAKADIDFAAIRSLLKGTVTTTFTRKHK